MQKMFQTLSLTTVSSGSKGKAVVLGRAGGGGLKDLKIGADFCVRSHAHGVLDVELCAFAVHQQRDGERPEAGVSYFGGRTILDGAVELADDDRTGQMAHDETIFFRLRQLPETVERVVVAAFIYREGEKLRGDLADFHEIVLSVEGYGDKLMAGAVFNCEGGAQKSAVVLGELYRQDGNWVFVPVGQARTGWAKTLCRMHGVETTRKRSRRWG